MSTRFRQFVLTQALGIAAVNAVINASYTFWLWAGPQPLTLFGAKGVAFDLASTPTWIAVLSTLLGTASIRQKLLDGRVVAPMMPVHALFDMVPRGIVLRAAILGASAVALLSLPMWVLLQASGMGSVDLGAAIGMKVALTVPFTFLIVPLVILMGLGDVQRMRVAKASS